MLIELLAVPLAALPVFLVTFDAGRLAVVARQVDLRQHHPRGW